MDIPVFEKPNSPDCIRCGACKKACPHAAICSGLRSQTRTPCKQNPKKAKEQSST
ncbi:MAG: 4Fe-4S binding protein [Oscillospiraceae bacterium]